VPAPPRRLAARLKRHLHAQRPGPREPGDGGRQCRRPGRAALLLGCHDQVARQRQRLRTGHRNRACPRPPDQDTRRHPGGRLRRRRSPAHVCAAGHSVAEIVAGTGSPIPAFPGIGASATGAGHRRDSCQYRGRLGGTVAAGRRRVHSLREGRRVQDPWSTPDGDVPPAGGRWVAFDYWQFVGPAAGAGQYQRQFSNVVRILTADPPEVLCRCWCLVER